MSAALPVTLDLLSLVEKTRQAMLAEEDKPIAKRDPRPAIRLYAMTAALAIMLAAAGVEVEDPEDPSDVLYALAQVIGEASRQNRAEALRGLMEMNRERTDS